MIGRCYRYTQKLLQIAVTLGCLTFVDSTEATTAKSLAELKAAYIYNIAKFSRWPEWKVADSHSTLNLCVYGSDDVADKLRALSGQMIGRHNIQVTQPRVETDFRQCHLLYIDPNERRLYRYILAYVNQQAVVTISDEKRFIRSGGLINLAEKNQRLHIEINKQLADKQQVGFSSKLLKLAEIVGGQR